MYGINFDGIRGDNMIFDYVVCILIVIGILGLVGGWKLINHFNYELNYKESLLFPISILILTILCLVDFSFIQIYVGWEFSISIVIYFLALLILYYIIRSIKLKKYIPLKSIIGYILMSVINLVVLFIILVNSTSNIDGWDALGLLLIYIVLLGAYLILLLLINIAISIIKIIRKDEINYKNIGYKISKFCFINLSAIILMIGLIFGIDYYNEYNHNKMIEKQKDVAEKYLKENYSKYKFEIINSYETGVICWMFGCGATVLKVEVRNIDFNKNFSIMVNKDLTIYEDEFKEIVEKEQKNSKEENTKKYLKDNYDILLEYNTLEEIENAYFIIDRQYQREEIDLFVKDIKNAYNYVEQNLCNLKDITLSFKYGNPFYEGQYEYQKTHGSINENEFTNELWIMVNDEYIFIEK